MVVSDPIADMLTRIRNASQIKKETVLIPNSKLKKEILEVLKKIGYIDTFKVDKENSAFLVVTLAYDKQTPAIKKVERVSKPGCRIYVKKSEIPQVLQGFGSVIISTSKGVMTGKEARKEGLGGELICKVY